MNQPSVNILPDTWIRKAIFKAIDNMEIEGENIPCYDSAVPTGANRDIPDNYVIMQSQTNEVLKENKCVWYWQSEILLEVYCGVFGSGNNVSRVFADNILNGVKTLTQDIELDAESGLSIITRTQSFPNDLVIKTDEQNVVRKFMRLNLIIE